MKGVFELPIIGLVFLFVPTTGKFKKHVCMIMRAVESFGSRAVRTILWRAPSVCSTNVQIGPHSRVFLGRYSLARQEQRFPRKSESGVREFLSMRKWAERVSWRVLC